MTKKKRNYLFISFTVLFFVAIPIIILFAQGYRLNLETRSIVKTGGVDFVIDNQDVNAFLGEKLHKKSSFIFKNIVFKNILPGEYEATLEKEGYQPWHKTVFVEAGRVTKFPFVRLFPEELTEQVYTKNIKQATISANKKLALAVSTTTETSSNETILLVDLEQGTTENVIALKPAERAVRMDFSPNSDIFYIHTTGPLGQSIYTGSAGRAQQLINWDSFLQRSYSAAYNQNNTIVPSNSANTIYVFEKQSNGALALNELRLEERIIRPDIINNIAAFKIKNGLIFYANREGALNRTDISTSFTTELSPTSVANISVNNSKIVLGEDEKNILVINEGELFLWQDGIPLQQIGNNVLDAAFAPDNKKIAYRDSNTITVYWLKEVFGPPQRMPGDTEEINIGNIKSMHWANEHSSHILARTGNKIIIAELDSRGRRNTAQYDIINTGDLFAVNPSLYSVYSLIQNKIVELKYK